MKVGDAALADLYEEEGARVARSANSRFGINRADAATAAHCFQIARSLRSLASADTHPKDGDVKQAPLVSGAVAESETPK